MERACAASKTHAGGGVHHALGHGGLARPLPQRRKRQLLPAGDEDDVAGPPAAQHPRVGDRRQFGERQPQRARPGPARTSAEGESMTFST